MRKIIYWVLYPFVFLVGYIVFVFMDIADDLMKSWYEHRKSERDRIKNARERE